MASVDSPRTEVSNRLESYINWHILPRWEDLSDDPASNEICRLFLQTVPPIVRQHALSGDSSDKQPVEVVAQMRANLIKKCKDSNVAIQPAEPLFSILRKIVPAADLTADIQDERPNLKDSLHAIKLHLEDVLPSFFSQLKEWEEEQKTEDMLNVLRKDMGQPLVYKEPPKLDEEDVFLCRLFLERADEMGIEHFVPQNPKWSPAEKVNWMFKEIYRCCTLNHIPYSENYSIGSIIQEIETRNCILLFKAIFKQIPDAPLLTGKWEEDSKIVNQWIEDNKESKALDLKKLDLSDAGLCYLPEQINFFKNLEVLILRDERISFLSSELDLPHLKTLIIEDVPMEFWPDDESLFPELEILSLTHSTSRGAAIEWPEFLLSRPNLRINTLNSSDIGTIRDAARYLTQPAVMTRIINRQMP